MIQENKIMTILVTGLASLQWGRLEYGNNGNYYLIAPIFRQLHRVFPDAQIVTTFQLSDQFKAIENVITLPLSQYFSWRENDGDLNDALKEYAIADLYEKTGVLTAVTPFIETLLQTSLLVSFNGDMWGDNRDSTGANRFFVDLLKNATAQKLGVPTVLFASSPGPIDDLEMRAVAKEVYESFNAVINREAASKSLFESYGYDVSNTVAYSCPAFLFGEEYYPAKVNLEKIKHEEGLPQTEKLVGIIVTTNSLPGGSFADWEREDADFDGLADLIEYIVNEEGETVVLFSHSEGFVLEPEFRRVHWRDYKMICLLYEVLKKRGTVDLCKVHRVDGIYPPWVIHHFIGSLDKLISGKMHGAVAGMEQFVPTLPIDFQNGPPSHKMQGLFSPIEMAEYIVPRGVRNLIPYYKKLSENKEIIKEKLQKNIPVAQRKALAAFDALANYVKKTGEKHD